MADKRVHELYRDLVSRKLDRRGFVKGAAAIGISAPAIGLFLKAADVRAQDAAAPPVVATGDGTQFAGVEISIAVIDASVKVPLDEVRPEFESATGAKVSIVAYPIPETLPKFIEDQVTGANEIDGVMIGMWWLGELVAGDFVLPIDDWVADTATYPDPALADEFAGVQALRKYGGKTYVIPFDADGQVLYYRRDLLTDPAHMEAYKTATGNDLGVPKTWDEMVAIATYFNGKDLGTGTPGTGVSMHLKTGGQGMFHYMSLSAPFIIGPTNPVHYWFNPETMEPLVKSEGHRRAMQAYLDLAKQGPEAQLGWALGEAWDWFLNGNAVFTYSWGDVAALAVERTSFVKGKIGTAQLPGTLAYINALTGEETATPEVNYAGNTTGGSWAGVVAKNSANAEATYYFWALMATIPKQQFYAARGTDGVDPGRLSQMPADVVDGGTGNIEAYLSQGWDETDAKEYTRAYYDSFANPNQLPYLRIPGTSEYWNALDIRLAEAVSGGQTPEQALEAMYGDFNEITDRLGLDAQLAEYKASFGL